MSPASTDHLERLLTPAVASFGADLDAVELAAAGRRQVLRIVVDRDGGLTLDDVADLTRAVSRELDAHNVMGQRSYTLEVTSRGVDRPLTQPRHWVRYVGRLVSVRLHDGNGPARVTGRIVGADEKGADLEVDGGQRRFAYADVAKARVLIEFARKDG